VVGLGAVVVHRIAFGRQHVKDGWLHFTQCKNRNRRPVTLDLPVLPELQAAIDAGPCGNLTFLVTAHGKPFTSCDRARQAFHDGRIWQSNEEMVRCRRAQRLFGSRAAQGWCLHRG
jgi:hypothetical protein